MQPTLPSMPRRSAAMAADPTTVHRNRIGALAGSGGYRLRTLVWPALVVSAGLAFALVPLATGRFFFYWDNAQQHYPQTDFLHRAIATGHIPQWWPQVGAGVATTAEGQAAHYHPIRLLLAAICPPPAAFMVEIGLYFALTGLGTYAFLREFRLARPACAVGSLIQMFGGFSLIFVRNMALHRSSFLVPFAMLCAERFVTRRRAADGLAAAAIFGLQLLAGHPTFALVTMLLTGVFIACRVVQRAWSVRASLPVAARQLATVSLQWSLVVVLGFGIAAIQVVPTLLHTHQSTRQGGLNFEYANSLPAKLEYLPQLLFPYAYPQGDWLAQPTAWGSELNIVPSSGIYVGALPVVLALVAVWWRRRWPDPSASFVACGLVALALSLGKTTPLFPALWSLPGMSGLRFPSRFLLCVSFSLACLAALGVQRTLARQRLGRRRNSDSVPFAALAAGGLGLGVVLWQWRTAYHAGIIVSFAVLAVSMAVALALRMAPRRYQAFVLTAMAIFVCADLWGFRTYGGYAPTVPIEEALAPPPVVDFLRTDPDRFRVMSLISVEQGLNRNDDLREFLQADLGAIWGIESADVWFSLMPKRYYALHEAIVWEMVHTPDAAAKLAGMLGALNVKYVIAPRSVTLLGWERVFETSRAATWKNPAYLPRAFLVGATVPENLEVRQEWVDRSTRRLQLYREMVANWWTRLEDAQLIDHVLARAVDYRTTAVVGGTDVPARAELDANAVVQSGWQDSDAMRFEVEANRPAFLVISSNNYPGWTATVNGRPATLHRTNWVTMGVSLPAGRAEVLLRFVAPGFYLGCSVTALALLLVAIGWIFARRTTLGRLGLDAVDVSATPPRLSGAGAGPVLPAVPSQPTSK